MGEISLFPQKILNNLILKGKEMVGDVASDKNQFSLT